MESKPVTYEIYILHQDRSMCICVRVRVIHAEWIGRWMDVICSHLNLDFHSEQHNSNKCFVEPMAVILYCIALISHSRTQSCTGWYLLRSENVNPSAPPALLWKSSAILRVISPSRSVSREFRLDSFWFRVPLHLRTGLHWKWVFTLLWISWLESTAFDENKRWIQVGRLI